MEKKMHLIFMLFLIVAIGTDNKLVLKLNHIYYQCSQTPELQGEKDRVLVQFN